MKGSHTPVKSLQINMIRRERHPALDEAQLQRLRAVLETVPALAIPRGDWLEEASVENLQVNLTTVSPARIRELNRQFRERDETTDVLSFPLLEMQAGLPQKALTAADFADPLATERTLPLGDLVICVERAYSQAERYGHSFMRELSFLAVHGLLHLLGYDHEKADEEAEMMDLTEKVLLAAGLPRRAGSAEPEHLVQHGSEGVAGSASSASRSEATASPRNELAALEEPLPAIRRAGYIALLGRPNAGKSTLLNRLAGMELAITSPKPQTTRQLIRAVCRSGDAQMVFLDVPGIHEARQALDRYMNQVIRTAIEAADILLLMIDARFRPQVEEVEQRIGRIAQEAGKPLILVLNKSDLAAKEKMLPLIAAFAATLELSAIVPISARSGDGVGDLLEEIRRVLPEREAIFASEDFTNQSEKQLAAEFIRQELLHQMDEEIPHGTAVLIDSFTEENNREGGGRRVRIEATIVCERKSHKGMILGRQGQRIKAIGSAARRHIGEMLDCPCDLLLYVRVREEWRRRPEAVSALGYRRNEIES